MVDAMGTLSMVFVAFVSFHLKFWTVPGMASTRRRSRVPGGWPVALCEHLTLAPPVRPAGFAGSDHDGEGLGWRPAVSGRTASAVDPPARTGDGAARRPMAAGTEPKPPPSAPCPPRTPRGRLAPGPERRGRGLCPLAAAPSPLSGRTPVRKCHVHLLGLGLCFSSMPSPERRRPGAGRTCRLQRVARGCAGYFSRPQLQLFSAVGVKVIYVTERLRRGTKGARKWQSAPASGCLSRAGNCPSWAMGTRVFIRSGASALFFK